MPVRKPSPKLRAFGAEVTKSREGAGLTRTDLAIRVAVSRSYVSQVESGSTRCREDFAKRLDDALSTGEALVKAWHQHIRETGYPKYFADFSTAEGTAALLRAYETRLVYGLLQVEAYARVILRSEEAVQARMRRQDLLTKEGAPTLFVVLDASILLRQVGSREVMREQLEHLIAMSARDNVILQIAPIAYHRDARASFTIATQADRSEAVYIETAVGGETSTEVSDLSSANETFSRLQAHSLSAGQSVEMMRKVVRELWT